MPDDDKLGTVELAKHYDISPQRARRIMRDWSESADGPTTHRFTGRWYVYASDLERWEGVQRAAGLPLPGERRRGFPRRSQA